MESYSAIFFNHAGQVFSEKAFEADDDRIAREYAHRVFTAQIGMGYELRQGKCLIDRVIFGSRAA
jgi:hypothetical protein